MLDKATITLINAMRMELRAVLDFPVNKSNKWREEVEVTIKTAERYILLNGNKPVYMNYEVLEEENGLFSNN